MSSTGMEKIRIPRFSLLLYHTIMSETFGSKFKSGYSQNVRPVRTPFEIMNGMTISANIRRKLPSHEGFFLRQIRVKIEAKPKDDRL